MSAKSDTQTTVPAFAPELLQQLLAERTIAGEIEDLLKDLRKAFIEHALQGELTHLLGYEKHAVNGRNSGNSRNGTSRKTIKTEDSTVELAISRDHNGAFEPQLLGKYERRWEGFDELILALYARGMSTRDIQDLLRQKYAVEISPQFVSDVCSAVSAGVAEWRARPLAAVWPIVYLDALYLKVRDDGRVVGKALYVAVGVNLEGRKELLGLWLAQDEGADSLSCF
jgi:putative transposase